VPRYYKSKRDANDGTLLAYGERCGFVMVRVGEPCDFFVGVAGLWFPVEIKNPDGKDQLSDAQKDFRKLCIARGLPPPMIWRTTADIDEAWRRLSAVSGASAATHNGAPALA